MDVKILGDLLDGLDAFERFERYAGFEFRVVSSSFCFHLVCAWFGLHPATAHHNHSLATGPIFRGRLSTMGCPSQPNGMGSFARARPGPASGWQDIHCPAEIGAWMRDPDMAGCAACVSGQ